MRLLLAVLDDLFSFAYTALFGVYFEKTSGTEIKAPSDFVMREYQTPQLTLPGTEFPKDDDQEVISSQTIDFHVGVGYFIGVPEVFLYIDPVVSFDSVLSKLTYGEMVYVSKFGGRWAQVETTAGAGWIFKDALREQATDVFPVLIEGELYDATEPQTEKLRLSITDSFGGGSAGVLLTDVEYVTYALLKKQIQINWPTKRPRIAGTWQQILRGRIGIHIGISPKTDAVMEYSIDEVEHICYVEAVFSDETIKVRGVGLLEEGVFTIMTLDKQQWRELRPVFIEVV